MEIGIIKILIGEAEAINQPGIKRALSVDQHVCADEIIITGPASAISIELNDGSFIDLGRESQVFLDKSMLN